MNQIEIISVEDLVPRNHRYRRFKSLWDFKNAEKYFKLLESNNNYKGYGY